MERELPILINITVALLAAFIGGLLARRLKLPSMVGYMLAGVAIGPFTPGFNGDLFTIQQLAELGVIFLLFDVGLHFSLRDLWSRLQAPFTWPVQDDGGVITDKQRRAAAFERLVGNCFVPLLGRTEAAWTRAHRAVVDRLADPLSMSVLTAADFVGFYRAYQLRWVGGMCELLDLPAPPEEECLDLAYRALGWIIRRIQAALPGAVEAIRLLQRQGYALQAPLGLIGESIELPTMPSIACGSAMSTRLAAPSARTTTLHGSSRLISGSCSSARCARGGLQAPRMT